MKSRIDPWMKEAKVVFDFLINFGFEIQNKKIPNKYNLVSDLIYFSKRKKCGFYFCISKRDQEFDLYFIWDKGYLDQNQDGRVHLFYGKTSDYINAKSIVEKKLMGI